MDINERKPWSPEDKADLIAALGEKESIAEIAAFLCRPVHEVEAQMRELEVVDAAVEPMPKAR
jgi:hypothetical protein